MSKFKVGDKVRKVDDILLDAFSIGEELFVTRTSCSRNYWVGKNIGEKTDTAFEDGLELMTAAPKEITLNGATYVLKEEPKLEHEWKFGDIAIHKEYGVGIVFGVEGGDTIVFKEKETLIMKCVSPRNLTFLRRTDFSV